MFDWLLQDKGGSGAGDFGDDLRGGLAAAAGGDLRVGEAGGEG